MSNQVPWMKILRTMNILASRRLLVDRIRMRCKQTDETILHALKEYPVAKEVSDQLKFTWDTDSAVQQNTEERLYLLVNALNHTHLQWRPPEPGVLKINFDGSVNKETRKGGLGVIIMDEKGEVMGAHASNMLCFPDSFTVEAYAVVRAVYFALEMGFRQVEMEGEALAIIK
ncbi:hypothetical protein CRYUN_Cryun22dG0046700 [Craigia yunnanensis]